jgi:hypothetical protein
VVTGGRVLFQKFNVGEYTDCPVFDNMMDFCKTYTGCSIGKWVQRDGLLHVADHIQWLRGWL